MVLGVGCWGYFLFGFLEYDHGFAPGSAAKANLLTGWVLQILLLDQHSDFIQELLIHQKSTCGRMFLVLVQSS
jgi:hypothetical protein